MSNSENRMTLQMSKKFFKRTALTTKYCNLRHTMQCLTLQDNDGFAIRLYDIVYTDFPLSSAFLFPSEDILMACRSAEGWFCRSGCRHPDQWGVCSPLYRFRISASFHNHEHPGQTLSFSSL